MQNISHNFGLILIRWIIRVKVIELDKKGILIIRRRSGVGVDSLSQEEI